MFLVSKFIVAVLLTSSSHSRLLAQEGQLKSKDEPVLESSGKILNLRVNVPALPIRLGMALDFKISRTWTLGPEADTGYAGQTNYGGITVQNSLYSLGGRAHWFRQGVYNSGLFISTGARVQSVNLSEGRPDGVRATKNRTGALIDGLVGYGWFWKSFNMMVGAGYLYYLNSPELEYSYDIANGGSVTASRNNFENGAKVDFSIGWTF